MNALAQLFAHPQLPTIVISTGTPRSMDRRLEITTDHTQNLVKIIGWSIALDLGLRYENVIHFIHTHLAESDELTVYFKYELFNPTTVKYLFTIIKLLNGYHAKGKKVEIHWNCGEEMDDMLDSGLDLAMLCNFEFKIALL